MKVRVDYAATDAALRFRDDAAELGVEQKGLSAEDGSGIPRALGCSQISRQPSLRAAGKQGGTNRTGRGAQVACHLATNC